MAAITSDTTDRVAAVIGDTLNGWFQPHLNFDPIVVRQRYDDWYDEDYLEAWIVWEGDYAYMDHRLTISLSRTIQSQLDDLGVDLPLDEHYIAKWEWDLNKERIIK